MDYTKLRGSATYCCMYVKLNPLYIDSQKLKCYVEFIFLVVISNYSIIKKIYKS